MSARLPPLPSVRAFEAAARLGGFQNASVELHLTAGAVAHQVKLLESWLGVALFQRLPRGVVLTRAGQQYASALRPLLDGIAEASAQACSRQGPHIAERAAAGLGQRDGVRAHRTEGVHRQNVQDLRQGLAQAVLAAGAGQRQCSQAGGRPGDLGHTQFGRLAHHPIAQGAFAAEQAGAGLDLHQDALVADGNAGRELQRPHGHGPERVRIGRVRGIDCAGQQQRCPQHGRAVRGESAAPTGWGGAAAGS